MSDQRNLDIVLSAMTHGESDDDGRYPRRDA